MRILIFHGYLLSGTGSNVYNARLAEALVGLGHEVHLFSQDRHPERHTFVGAAGDWDSGRLQLSAIGESRGEWGSGEQRGDPDGGIDRGDGGTIRPSPGCTVYRPNIGGLLPLYVQDRYEEIEAKTFADCSDEEIARYIQANVDAVREVAELVRPVAALANHLVMGPVILARALGKQTPYAVKVHGSALEYTVKPEPERFMGFAREGLAGAKTVLVGSLHTAESLWRGAWRGGRGSGQAAHPSRPSRGRRRALPPARAARGVGGHARAAAAPGARRSRFRRGAVERFHARRAAGGGRAREDFG